ncbi:trace amine-associated receptor 13c-like [Electrophorus electricus]|uniref:G-protein coupled receptors family 1 profile domain-containing protein n=1 Tax=Electrophorus electricus TaxID=8005 RepID=A0A4W4FG23_ELEEL|nr:trace amine-associated receptor 13c-like [Electrophorus electricus]
MDMTEDHQNMTVQYCFPGNNFSCIMEVRTGPGNVLLFTFLSCISVCTVFLNLLVIIAISHFKQLHTPTNLLVLSLAVADLLVGLIVMPVKIMELLDNCWYLGKTICSLFPVIVYIIVSASVGSLVFIAIDRYIAINDPLLYSTKITVFKTSVFIVINWSCSILYNFLFYYFEGHLLQTEKFTCLGECVVAQDFSSSVADLVFSFICPCFVIVFLYLNIFKVARQQAKIVNAVEYDTHGRGVKGSKNKAAKTLGIVICVYLTVWIPYYLGSVSVESLTSSAVVWTVFSWLIYINSSVNPLIYAIFYPWFRVSSKYIVTCKIFESSSSRLNLFPE